jgi:predicted PurR-regulated permease PerM
MRSALPWLVAVALAALVWWHAGIVVPFLLSLVLAYVLEPAVDRLQRCRVPRALAVALCILLVFVIGSVLLVLLVPIVSQLVPMLRSEMPGLLSKVWSEAEPRLSQLGLNLPDNLEELKAELAAILQTHGAEWGSAIWHSVVVGGSGLMALAGLALLVPMLAFYWLLDWDRLTRAARGLLPVRWRPRTEALLGELDDIMGQYLRGQSLLMLVLAVYYSVGLSLFGFDLALPIGVFTGLAVCIPYLGFGLGMVLALAAGLLQFAAAGEGLVQPLLGVAVVYGAGQVIESFVLTPRLVGERIGLHPLGVILALMVFGQWLGFWGLLIALPCAACLTVVGRQVLNHWRQSESFSRVS